jgi:protein-S-isoprenylcysteine O-methyltransferase Ste14
MDEDEEEEYVEKYKKLHGILLGKKDWACLQRRRAIEKAERKKTILVAALLLNLVLVFGMGFVLEYLEYDRNEVEWSLSHKIYIALTTTLFILSLSLYTYSASSNPGFIET